jgi:hypothetical protein
VQKALILCYKHRNSSTVENRIEYVTTVLECPALGVSLQDVLLSLKSMNQFRKMKRLQLRSGE